MQSIHFEEEKNDDLLQKQFVISKHFNWCVSDRMPKVDWGRLKVNSGMTAYQIVCMILEQMFQMTLNS